MEAIGFENRNPSSVKVVFTDKGELSLSFTFFGDDEIKVLKVLSLLFKTTVKAWRENRSGKGDAAKTITKECTLKEEEQ